MKTRPAQHGVRKPWLGSEAVGNADEHLKPRPRRSGVNKRLEGKLAGAKLGSKSGPDAPGMRIAGLTWQLAAPLRTGQYQAHPHAWSE